MFTVNWFEQTGQKNFEKHLKCFSGKEKLNFLEVGAYEGRATVWMLENILTDKSCYIEVIDTFQGSVEHQEKRDELQIDTLKNRFFENTKQYHDKMTIHIGFSHYFLNVLCAQFEKEKYDFIYIDASHQAADVIEDAVLAFKLLKVNGIMGFDDYKWNKIGDPLQHPQIALDAFVSLFADKLQVIDKNYQLFIRKICC